MLSTECKRDELELPKASQFKMFLSHSVVSKPTQTLLFNSNNLCLISPGYHSHGPGLQCGRDLKLRLEGHMVSVFRVL